MTKSEHCINVNEDINTHLNKMKTTINSINDVLNNKNLVYPYYNMKHKNKISSNSIEMTKKTIKEKRISLRNIPASNFKALGYKTKKEALVSLRKYNISNSLSLRNIPASNFKALGYKTKTDALVSLSKYNISNSIEMTKKTTRNEKRISLRNIPASNFKSLGYKTKKEALVSLRKYNITYIYSIDDLFDLSPDNVQLFFTAETLLDRIDKFMTEHKIKKLQTKPAEILISRIDKFIKENKNNDVNNDVTNELARTIEEFDKQRDEIHKKIQELKRKEQKINEKINEENKNKFIQLMVHFYSNDDKTDRQDTEYNIGHVMKTITIELPKSDFIRNNIKIDHIYFFHDDKYKTGGEKTPYKMIREVLKKSKHIGGEGFEDVKKRKSEYFHPLAFELSYIDEYTGTDQEYIEYVKEKKLKYTAQGFQIVNRYITKKNLKRLSHHKYDHIGKVNACFYDAILSQFKKAYDTREYKEPLTYELIKRICITEEDPQYNKLNDYSLSINQAMRFFKKIHAKLIIINQDYETLYIYNPKQDGYKKDKKFNTLYGLYKDNHIYHLTQNIQSLKEKINDHKELYISNVYNLTNPDEQEYIYSNELQHIIKIIKSGISTDKKINIKYEGDMLELFKYLMEKLMITPQMVYNGNITSLKIGNGKKSDSDLTCNIVITSIIKDGNDEKKQLKFNNEEQFKTFIELYNELYKNVINEKYICNYNEDVLRLFNEYSRGAISGILPYVKFNEYKPFEDFENIEPSYNADIDTGLTKPEQEETLKNIYKIDHEQFKYYDVLEKYDEIDINKAYTSLLMNIEKIPVFSISDTVQEYKNEKINIHAIYLVELLDPMNDLNFILFNKKYNILRGETLQQVKKDNINIKINYVIYPSRVEQLNIKLIIEKIYKSELDPNLKKNIVNYIIGTLGKRYNNKTLTRLFRDKEEAIIYNNTFQGFISKITEDVTLKEKLKYIRSYIDQQGNEAQEERTQDFDTITDMYAVSKTEKRELINGFFNFKIWIYDAMRLKMYNLYKQFEEVGARPIGIFTDALICEDANKWINKYNIDITTGEDVNKYENIGNFKRGSKKYDDLHETKYKVNELLNIEDFKTIQETIKDEYDMNEIFKIYDKNNLLITADLPGSGKSESVKYYMKYRGFRSERDENGNYTFYKLNNLTEKQYITNEQIKENVNKSLVITPYNTLCDDYIKDGFNAITLNILLGVHKDDNKFIKNYNIEGVGVILFDEVYTHNYYMLVKLYQFVLSHPEIRCIATGDFNQLEEIAEKNGYKYVNNDKKYNSVNDKLIHMTFKHTLNYIIPKRYSDKETIEKIMRVKDLLINKKDIKGTLKLLKRVDFKDITTTSNVSYMNYTAQQLNLKIHKEQFGRTKNTLYKRGDILICKIYNKKRHFKINFKYTISRVNYGAQMLDLDLDGDEIKISFEEANAWFRLPYTYTAHSVKGMTLSDDITILDIETPLVWNDPKWLYTAITRCRNINNVKYCNNAGFFNMARLDKTIKEKIRQHKQTDIKSKKFNPYKFITPEYIHNMIKGKINEYNKCPVCCEKLEYFDKKSQHMFSIDRINKKYGHNKGNVQLMCVNCNKKNIISKDPDHRPT